MEIHFNSLHNWWLLFYHRNSWNLEILSQNSRGISRITGPILGLFVLIGMHFSCWIQIWQWKFEFWNFFKIFQNLDLSSALNIDVEMVNSTFACFVKYVSGSLIRSRLTLLPYWSFLDIHVFRNDLDSQKFYQHSYFVAANANLPSSMGA